MATDPYAAFSSPTKPAVDPYAAFSSPVQASPEPAATQEPWQARVKPYALPFGRQTVQREDGMVWLDQSKGATVSGWVLPGKIATGPGGTIGLMSGQPTMDRPGQAPPKGFFDRAIDNLMFNPVVHGPTDLVAGGVQLAANVLPLPQAAKAYVNAGIRNREQAYQDLPMNQTDLAGVTRAMAGMAPMVVAPMLAPGRAAAPLVRPSLGARIGTGATQSAAYSLAQPVVLQPGEDDQFAKEKAKQAAVGAAVGSAIPVVATGVGKAGRAIVKGTRKVLGGAMTQNAEAEAAQLMADSAKVGAPLKPSTISAAIKPPSEELTGAAAAVQSYSDRLAAEMRATPFAGLRDVEAAAMSGGKRAAAAQAILDQIKRGGEEARHVVQTSAGLQSFREKMRMDQLFATRDALAKGVNVNPSRTIAAIDAALSEVNGVDATKWPGRDAAIAKLQQFRESLVNTKKLVPSKILDPSGNPYMQELDRPNSFLSMSRTRSDIGDDLSDYFRGNNQEIGQKGANIIQSVKSALMDDISAAAQSSKNPVLAEADLFARSEYSKFADTFKDPAVIALIGSDNPTKIMAQIARSGPDHAQKIWNVLEPKGRRAVLKNIFDEAVGAKAYNKRTDDFIPGNISGAIIDRFGALGVVAKGEDRAMVDGMLNVTQALARANPSQASALGQRITDSAVSAAGKAGAVVGALKSMRGGFIDWAFDTPMGRNFLFQASNTKPGTPAFQKLLDKYAPVFAGIQSGRAIGAPKPSTQEPQP